MIALKGLKRYSKLGLAKGYEICYSKEGNVRAHPQTIFSVIKSTERYADFIPWCSKSTITKRISDSQNFTSLTIAFQKVQQLSYSSHVRIYAENDPDVPYKIQSICRERPLKSLVSTWQIQKKGLLIGQEIYTPVKYAIQYEFASPLLQLTSHLFLNYVGESMWLIFKEQAEKSQTNIDASKGDKDTNKDIDKDLNEKNTDRTKPASHSNIQADIREDQQVCNEKKHLSSLQAYLSKNVKIGEMYHKNKDFRRKVDDWNILLKGTQNFEEKLSFKIKNYLIHKG